MAIANGDRVLFAAGTSSGFSALTKSDDTMYFLTDTNEIYLGAERYSFGGLALSFVDAASGTTLSGEGLNGKVVTGIEVNNDTRSLTVKLGTGVTSAAQDEINAALAAATADSNVLSYTAAGQGEDYGDIDLVIKPANEKSNASQSTAIGDVIFEKSATGLAATVDVGVKGVKSTENVISLDANEELSTTLSLAYDSTNHEIQLLGIGNAEVATLDATPFIKDGMLDSASLITGTQANTETSSSNYTAANTYLKLVFNTVKETAAGSAAPAHETIYLDVTDLIDVYTAGTGLTLSNGQFALDHTAIAAETSTAKTAAISTFGGSATTDFVKYDANGLITGTGTLTISIPALTGGTVGGAGKVVTSATLNTSTGALTGDTLNIRTSGIAIDATLTSSQQTEIPNAAAVLATAQNAAASATAVWQTFGS